VVTTEQDVVVAVEEVTTAPNGPEPCVWFEDGWEALSQWMKEPRERMEDDTWEAAPSRDAGCHWPEPKGEARTERPSELWVDGGGGGTCEGPPGGGPERWDRPDWRDTAEGALERVAKLW
jgi:hypothetical protein